MSGADYHELLSQSLGETEAIGNRLGRALRGGEVIGLVGNLGAGKTRLTKGIALGAGFQDSQRVTSPTFVLINEYPGRVYIYHIDTYRLRSAAELRAIGFDEMAESGGTVIIEWADRVQELMPPDWLEIQLEVISALERRFTCQAHGPRSQRLLKALQAGSIDE